MAKQVCSEYLNHACLSDGPAVAKLERDSENMLPFVATVSLAGASPPIHVKLNLFNIGLPRQPLATGPKPGSWAAYFAAMG